MIRSSMHPLRATNFGDQDFAAFESPARGEFEEEPVNYERDGRERQENNSGEPYAFEKAREEKDGRGNSDDHRFNSHADKSRSAGGALAIEGAEIVFLRRIDGHHVAGGEIEG